MDVDYYKKLTTSRGFVYSYYLRTPSAQASADLDDPPLPLLLFLHGFPTCSRLWHRQVKFFHERGFPVCVPDLLGFGGSSKPRDERAYTPSLVCRDVIEILDAEGFDSVIAIGHSLGSKIVSRLANFYPERFLGYAFLAVPYSAPRPNSKIGSTLKTTKKMCGYELYGHVLFYAQAEASELIEHDLDSFFSALFPSDPKMWVTEMAPIGALQSWLERGMKAPMASYLKLEDLAGWRDKMAQEGIASALCWHKALVSGINADDDKSNLWGYDLVIPLERYRIHQPVFFAAAHHDYVSRSVLGIATIRHNCTNATIREFSDGHWLMMSSPAKVNGALFSWIMDCI